jgi:hypothetical protein
MTPTKQPRSLKHPPHGVNDLLLQLRPEVPTWNFFTPMRSNEMEADQGDDASYTNGHQQHQALTFLPPTLTLRATTTPSISNPRKNAIQHLPFSTSIHNLDGLLSKI